MERAAARGRLTDQRARAIDQRGICFQELGLYDKAEHLHRKALGLAERLGDHELQLTSLANLGEVLRKRGHVRRAARVALRAERIARSHGDTQREIAIAHNRALTLDAAGESKAAEKLLRGCRERARRQRLWREYVRAWEGLANLSWGQRREAVAERRYRRALVEGKKHKLPELQTEISLNLASLLATRDRHGDALRVLLPQKERFRSVPNPHEAYILLAELCEKAGKMRLAEKCWETAKPIASGLGQADRFAYCCGALAALYEDRRQLVKAGHELQQALEKEQNPDGRTHLLVQQCRLALERKKDKEAERAFGQARDLALKHDLKELYVDLHMMLGDHNWTGPYKSKLEGMKAYITVVPAALETSFEVGTQVLSHMLTRLLEASARELPKLANSLYTDLAKWLRKQKVDEKVVRLLLTPFRVAVRLSPMPATLSKAEAKVAKAFEEELRGLGSG